MLAGAGTPLPGPPPPPAEPVILSAGGRLFLSLCVPLSRRGFRTPACARVRVCAHRACVRAYVCAYVCACVCADVFVCLRHGGFSVSAPPRASCRGAGSAVFLAHCAAPPPLGFRALGLVWEWGLSFRGVWAGGRPRRRAPGEVFMLFALFNVRGRCEPLRGVNLALTSIIVNIRNNVTWCCVAAVCCLDGRVEAQERRVMDDDPDEFEAAQLREGPSHCC